MLSQAKINELREILTILHEKKDFLTNRTEADEEIVRFAFDELAAWFGSLGEEQLLFPNEFRESLSAHKNNDKRVMTTLDDVRNRYLIMSELKDFLRLKYKINL